ncbi:uncharacterized protein LOC129966557 isoform X2 [Argiope bruennichi]|uniref:Uncharacterized protein n=1 Tax=Argiope bruennichi TaxID=94029 RepID=A0A8T0E7B6_ARGBR|nr:uncharacterized protein LOC129966557 isoform X2 [Argiope bruennichi]KAF8767220.1 hypothetical protein HNY73_020206 [Argiope bruennichi]
METSTAPETSESQDGSLGPSPSLENPSITTEEKKICCPCENDSVNDIREEILEKLKKIEDLEKKVREVQEEKKKYILLLNFLLLMMLRQPYWN